MNDVNVPKERVFEAILTAETVALLKRYLKICERLPLVLWRHCSCSQYPWLRGVDSSDCDGRKPHRDGV